MSRSDSKAFVVSLGAGSQFPYIDPSVILRPSCQLSNRKDVFINFTLKTPFRLYKSVNWGLSNDGVWCNYKVTGNCVGKAKPICLLCWAFALGLTKRRRKAALSGADVQWEAPGKQIC